MSGYFWQAAAADRSLWGRGSAKRLHMQNIVKKNKERSDYVFLYVRISLEKKILTALTCFLFLLNLFCFKRDVNIFKSPYRITGSNVVLVIENVRAVTGCPDAGRSGLLCPRVNDDTFIFI